MDLYIKNMVCHRCKMVVEDTLKKLGLHPESISLGHVVLGEKELTREEQIRLQQSLEASGFELIDDKRKKLVEGIKNIIIQSVHHEEGQPKKNFSEIIARHLHHDYSYLSNLFSETEGTTIEQYIINQRIEKVKELLVYGELSLSEIAFQLGYSSTAHLSNQFKKITGMTPSAFRQIGLRGRRPLDDLSSQK